MFPRKTPPSPRLLLCALPLIVCGVALAPFVLPQRGVARQLSEFGFTDDRAGVEQLLATLIGERGDTEKKHRELLRQLDSDNFAEREAATIKLAHLPVIDREKLEQIAKTMPPEVAMRIARALKQNNPERFDNMVKAALDTVIGLKEKGLIEPLFNALEGGKQYNRGQVWNKAGEAARVTAGPDDIPFLKKSLASKTAVVRGAAVEAIIECAGKDAVDILIEADAAADPDAYVKWGVAKHLALESRRECLKPLAELLTCDDDFGVRWRSLDELRRITGQEFGYYAAGNADERAVPAKKWRAWVDEHGATADLNFGGRVADTKETLFNGHDLSGWEKEADEDKGLPLDPAAKAARISGWKVEGGVLVCTGLHPGGLRTQRNYLNYELELEYQLPGGIGDSGVGVLAGKFGDGYLEVQLLHGKSGDLYRIGDLDVQTAEGEPLRFQAQKLKDSNELVGEWNKMRLRVVDGAVEVSINDVVQNRALKGPKRPSSIVLRNETSRVEFRNIVLKKL